MLGRIRFVKHLFRDLPQSGKLAYCLLRDDRVPGRNKAAFGAAIAIGLNPMINLPELIPVVGELDTLAVTLLSLRLFIASCPDHLVEEHRRLLSEHRSRFDEDLRAGDGVATRLLRRLRGDDHDPSHPVDYVNVSATTPPAAGDNPPDRSSGVSA